MNHETMVSFMETLDSGSNMFGALKPHIRARLFAAAARPGQRTWEDAHTVIITTAGYTTLWQAVLEYTDYPVRSKIADEPWPAVPTTKQIITALFSALDCPLTRP